MGGAAQATASTGVRMEEQGELAGPDVAWTKGADAPAARLVFRLVVGSTSLAANWLVSALRALDQLRPPADWSQDVVPADAPSVVVGALSAALRWRPTRARQQAATSLVGRAARRGMQVLGRLPGAGRVDGRYRELREQTETTLRQWAEEGARETLAGRRLARLAAPGFFELVVARLAQSPELRAVIQEQSEGLASSSVAELRERSELADRIVDRLVRRMLRRARTRPASAEKSAPP
jgi:hypothetical protein